MFLSFWWVLGVGSRGWGDGGFWSWWWWWWWWRHGTHKSGARCKWWGRAEPASHTVYLEEVRELRKGQNLEGLVDKEEFEVDVLLNVFTGAGRRIYGTAHRLQTPLTFPWKDWLTFTTKLCCMATCWHSALIEHPSFSKTLWLHFHHYDSSVHTPEPRCYDAPPPLHPQAALS